MGIALSEYRQCAMFIDTNPEVTVRALQVEMDIQRVSQAELADLTRTNKAKISRDFNGKTKLRPEMAFSYARALGGTLRLKPTEARIDHIVFDNTTDPLDKLIEEMRLEPEPEGKNAIVYNEMPIAICRELGIDAKNFFIFLEGPGQVEIRPEKAAVAGEGYVIVFTDRKDSGFDFGMLLSPDGMIAAFGVWLRSGKLSALSQHRDYIGFDGHEADLLKTFSEEHSAWAPYWYIERAVMLLPIKTHTERQHLYAELGRAFDAYRALAEKQVGHPMTLHPHGQRSLTEMLLAVDPNIILSSEAKESVLDDRKNECEMDSGHELFEGEDGTPYVEVTRLIPIKPETMALYGDKLKSTANAIVLCPMCAAKLEHGSWKIKEDMLLELYDKKIDDMKDAGLDVSKFDVLAARKPKPDAVEDIRIPDFLKNARN